MKPTYPLIFVLALMCLSACDKERITIAEEEQDESWEENKEFTHDEKIQLNSFATDDELYLVGQNYFSTIESAPTTSDLQEVAHAPLGFEYPSQYTLPVNDNLFAGYSGEAVVIYPNKNPSLQKAGMRLPMAALDPDFARFDFPRAAEGKAMALNGFNQLLVPYRAYEKTPHGSVFVSEHTSYMLIDLTLTNRLGSDFVDTVQSRVVRVDQSFSDLHCLHTIKDRFIVSTSRHSYRVSDSQGLVKILERPIYKVITKNGISYAFTDGLLYRSGNEGASWEYLTTLSEDYWLYNYQLIDNQIIAYRRSKLVLIEIRDRVLTATELDNTGLEGNQITSIAQYRDKVYLTTLSGVFHKNLTDFFTDKKPAA